MQIQKSQSSDLNVIMNIYAAARIFMAENGNPTQWASGYPPLEAVVKDIKQGHHYVLREGKDILATFILPFGIDPTYAQITEPGWLNDAPYGAIHRVAVNPEHRRKGLGSACLQAAEALAKKKTVQNLRIDTHPDNIPMQRAILKNGYTYCGIITVHDGSNRYAYQKVLGAL